MDLMWELLSPSPSPVLVPTAPTAPHVLRPVCLFWRLQQSWSLSPSQHAFAPSAICSPRSGSRRAQARFPSHQKTTYNNSILALKKENVVPLVNMQLFYLRTFYLEPHVFSPLNGIDPSGKHFIYTKRPYSVESRSCSSHTTLPALAFFFFLL